MSQLEFFERAHKLRGIDRCSNTSHILPYSVAEHSFYLALYAMVFAHMENERIEEEGGIDDSLYNIELVLQKALVHDLEESITGDILFPLHNNYPEFKDKLDFIRNRCVEAEVFQELSLYTREKFIQAWKSAKDDSKEGQLVACMDKFEILIYAISEIQLGNVEFYQIYSNAISIIQDNFRIPSVLEVIEEITDAYGE